VNLGDILPFVLQEPHIQGITSGDITVEDPLNKLKVYINAQTEQTYFEDDSIGIVSINGYWDNVKEKANFNLISENPSYDFKVSGNINVGDPEDRNMDINAAINDTRLSILKKYLSVVFSEMDGTAQGNLRLSGKLNSPQLTGSVKIKNAGLRIDYTQVYYKLNDNVINFKPGVLDIGEITLTDKYGNTGIVSGTLKHKLFRDLEYNFQASSKKLLVLNTNKINNDVFYGSAVARMNFRLNGPEENMKMYLVGEPVDSSRITILTSTASKESEDVDYIVWRQYGREMNVDSLRGVKTNLSIDLDLSANTFLKMAVVLDEVTGDSITATGDGSIKILTGTNETMTMNGRYNIDRGYYNFKFQEIFNKPFTLEQGSGSYMSWTGNPYNAEININATYLAEKVRMSSLFDESNKAGVSSVSSDVMREISDVIVKCNLSGTLSAPNPSFEIVIPQNSTVKNNASVDNKIKTINRDPNEVSKQSTYLIVFKSFAPQAAVVSNDINNDLINNTIPV
jgi:autotransporter translocation and assembly factor TamB